MKCGAATSGGSSANINGGMKMAKMATASAIEMAKENKRMAYQAIMA